MYKFKKKELRWVSLNAEKLSVSSNLEGSERGKSRDCG